MRTQCDANIPDRIIRPATTPFVTLSNLDKLPLPSPPDAAGSFRKLCFALCATAICLLTGCVRYIEVPAPPVEPLACEALPGPTECIPAPLPEKACAPVWPTPVCPEPKPCPACPARLAGKKVVFGEYESAVIDPPGIKYRARIDTGAASTSVHATDIKTFERDGQDWIRFTLVNPEGDKSTTLERKRIRKVRIKQANDSIDRRVTVMLAIHIGDIKRTIEVTLSDRSDMEYPVLIGRNFLIDKAIVDVSLRNVTK